MSAAPLTISNITGQWQNHVADGSTDPTVNTNNNAGSAQDEIHWGATLPQSGYLFDPVDGSISPALNSVFALGLFTHQNNPIIGGSGFFSVEYFIQFDANGTPSSLSNTFLFEHNETPNDEPSDICPAGDTEPCADIVTVSQDVFNQVIDVDGVQYFFNLLGFSTDGGTTFSNVFVSDEGNDNFATLYAQVTEAAIPEVPEPASLGLMGAGLAFVAHQVRRRRKN